MSIPIILDVDPGHDDGFLIFYSLFSQYSNILGISTTGGNQTLDKVTINALNCLNLFTNQNVFDNNDTTDIKNIDIHSIPVVRGAEKSLLGDVIPCPEIHGESGLDTTDKNFQWPPLRIKPIESIHSVNYFAQVIKNYALEHNEKVHIIATGRLTNIALLLTMYPDIIPSIAQITIMGGSFCAGGNTGPTAEFNIQIDPEAAQIVFNHGCSPNELILLQTIQTTPLTTILKKVPIVLIPLDITHTVLVTDDIINRIKETCVNPKTQETSKFGYLLADLLQFFSSSYRDTFGFLHGPPLHDPVTFFYLSCIQHNKSNNTILHANPDLPPVPHTDTSLPSLFTTKHVFIEVDTTKSICRGTTAVDFHHLMKKAPNIILGLKVNVDAFWDHFLSALNRANKQCILCQE